MKTVLLAVLCFWLSACALSTTPLSPLAPLAAGDPLLGTWFLKEGKPDEATYLHIGNQEDAIQMISVSVERSGQIKSEKLLAASTALAGHNYLSLQIQENGKTLYLICKYQITGNDTLTFWAPSAAFVKNAIRQGLIAGTASSTLLSADQQALRKFFVQHDSDLYPETETIATFTRAAP